MQDNKTLPIVSQLKYSLSLFKFKKQGHIHDIHQFITFFKVFESFVHVLILNLPFPQISPDLLTLPPQLKYHAQFVQPKYSWIYLQLETGQLNWGYNPRESCIFTKQLIMDDNCSPRAETSSPAPVSMLGADVVQTCIAFVHTVKTTVNSHVQLL